MLHLDSSTPFKILLYHKEKIKSIAFFNNIDLTNIVKMRSNFLMPTKEGLILYFTCVGNIIY